MDSSSAHLLRQGNLFPPEKRPLLLDPSVVLNLRRLYADRFTFLRDYVYCVYMERLYVMGLISEVCDQDFQVAFIAIPGSAFSKNETDNNLPNLYRMSVKWPATLDRLRKGDKFHVSISIAVPDCPAYIAPEVPCTTEEKVVDPDEVAEENDAEQI